MPPTCNRGFPGFQVAGIARLSALVTAVPALAENAACFRSTVSACASPSQQIKERRASDKHHLLRRFWHEGRVARIAETVRVVVLLAHGAEAA